MTQDTPVHGRPGSSGEQGLFARLGRLVAHHPWRVIGVWIVAAIAVIGLAPHLASTTDEASFLPSHYESIQAQNLQQSAFPQAAAPASIIVLERADGGQLTMADSATVQELAGKLEQAHVADVTALQVGQPSANRLIQTIGIQMPTETDPQDTHQTAAVKALRTQLQTDLSGTTLKGGITGTAAQNLDSQSSGNKADALIAVATIGLIIVLLLVIFRSPIIAFLPIITIGIVSQLADGLIAWASDAFDLKTDSSVTSLLIVVLFGVGTDYILFFMYRYRERLRAGDSPRDAVAVSVAWAGEAIASAAGAVIVAFMALSLSTLGLFRSLGPSLAIAVAVTLLAGLTLIPAIVALLGTRVFWPSKAWHTEPRGARFAAIGRAMGRRPARFAAVSGIVMAALAIAAFSFRPTFDLSAGSSSSTAESSVWQNQLLRGEPAGATVPTQVYLKSAIFVDIQSAVDHDYAVVFPVAAILIMLILALVLRAVVAPLCLMASVGLGFGATLGATVLLFQNSGGNNGLIFMLPVIMYMFVVALGTDYNILMITRLREEARAGRPPREAAAEAVRHAGPTIGAAGIILAGSFASLMLAGQSTLSQMGFAISAGIAMAAFVMAMFFTPAVTALIGHAAWWPGHGATKNAAAPQPTSPQPTSPTVEETEPAAQLR